MSLSRISLSNFRNHANTTLEHTGQFNLLVGPNGAGKTNILEALSLFAPGRGMRRAPLAEMSRQGGQPGFSIGGDLLDRQNEVVRLGTFTDPERPNRRNVRINSAGASAVALGEWLSIGWLTPAMDGLFTTGASARRQYLDRLVVALDPSHTQAASRYAAALRERNRLLSDDRPPDPVWLDGVERQMAEHGSRLADGRAQLVARLMQELAATPAEPFVRPALTYQPGGPVETQSLQQALHDARARDGMAGRSLVGPHRDDLIVVLPVKQTEAARCSTGEQKAMLIAMTLAHARLAVRDRPNVLLLDEIAAHLDPQRRAALFDRLRDDGAQVWMTGTETWPFAPILAEATVWQVENGSVRMA